MIGRSRRWSTWPGRGKTLACALAAALVTLGLAAVPPASSATVQTETWYVLVNKNSGKALEVFDFATHNGAKVGQWSRNDGAWQQWRFLDSGDGYYRLLNRHSGKVLDVPAHSTANGTALDQWSDTGGTNVQFRLEESAGGYVRLVNRHSDKAVGVSQSSTADGADVVQWTDMDVADQQWQLVPVDTQVTTTVDTNTWYVLVNSNSGKALDDYNLGTNDGAKVAQWSRNDGAWQQWRFLDSGDGYYRLLNRHSNKVLHVPGASTANGTGLVQWTDGNRTNEQFRVVESAGGYVRLINRNSGKAAGVSQSSTANGADVLQWTDLDVANQRWQLVPVGSVGTPGIRPEVNLDAGWRFVRSDPSNAQTAGFDDSTWSSVTVPHTWNAQDGQDGGNNYHRGVGWYRRHYTPPPSLAGKKLWLQFDGANQVAEVWVNGTKLGTHKGGYARFRFEATDALNLGQDNVIAVRVSNAHDPNVAPLDADFTFFGGIYRSVSLIATDPLQFRMLDYGGPGVYVTQRSLSGASATVDVTSKIFNNTAAARAVRIRTLISDADGTVVSEAATATINLAANAGHDPVQTLSIDDPREWNGTRDPHLYRATVELVDATTGQTTDVVTQRFGLRNFSSTASGGATLNGQAIELHGVNAHQDRLNEGWATSAADHVQDFDIMDEMGVNALRTAHYQQNQLVYDLADERGYLVWTEIPLVNYVSGDPVFGDNAKQQLRELIRQNYNHPSVVFWGIGNEQRIDDPDTNALLASLADIVAEEDANRQSAYAHCCNSDTGALTGHADLAGYNRYFGWYEGEAGDIGPWAASLHSSQPNLRISVAEYGAGGSIFQHAENPGKPGNTVTSPHPEEYQATLHEKTWAQIEARSYLNGTFIWNMFDFASDGRAEGDTAGRNDKGLVTYDRSVRKDAFYFYKAAWTTTPFVYLTSRRWTNRTNAVTAIKAYGNVESMKLFVNGQQVGSTVTSSNDIYRWNNVTLSPGSNQVKVVGTRNGRSYTDTVVWTLS